jgi:hypothetical protein
MGTTQWRSGERGAPSPGSLLTVLGSRAALMIALLALSLNLSGCAARLHPAHRNNGALALRTGTYDGYLRALNLRTRHLTIDRVLWYQGAAAKRACVRDHIPIPRDDERCHDYYVHDLKTILIDPVARSAMIASEISFNQKSLSASGYRLTLGQVSSLMKRAGSAYTVYRITVRNGIIVALFGLYQP